MGIKGTQIHPFKPNRKTQPNCQPENRKRPATPINKSDADIVVQFLMVKITVSVLLFS